MSEEIPEERVRKHIVESDEEEDDAGQRIQQYQERVVASLNEDGEPDYQREGVVMDEHTRKREALETRMNQALKRRQGNGGRRSRRDEEDLEQMLDDKILRLKDEMTLAAQRDMETIEKRINYEEDEEEDGDEDADNDDEQRSSGNKNGGADDEDKSGKELQPAMEKVKLLPKVAGVLNKVNLADTILDNNLLQAVKFWLEPLPDGSLPSFEIQKTLIQAIEKLPIKTEHLKESGLGKVMIFYTKSSKVEPKLKRLADKIVAEWTRPIIGASDNYRDKRIMKIDFDIQKYKEKSTQELKKNLAREKQQQLQRASAATTATGGANAADSSNMVKKAKHKKSGSSRKSKASLYEQEQLNKTRTTIPQQTTTDYKYAPVSNLDELKSHQLSIKATGVGASLNNSELYKRINSRLGNTSKRRK